MSNGEPDRCRVCSIPLTGPSTPIEVHASVAGINSRGLDAADPKDPTDRVEECVGCGAAEPRRGRYRAGVAPPNEGVQSFSDVLSKLRKRGVQILPIGHEPQDGGGEA